ncbi:hypothetical protein [Paraburkholderia acidisoli]|uniref:hypothetical protein n=1 Tax=Paraburkholderia acidisoli TaxID=2571748 RepID=UPI00131DFFA4|nr:hypothetical protein [Paraburkholderia acidisoli]
MLFTPPISKAVFDQNFALLAATKATLEGKGRQYLMSAGPRVAALTLRAEGLRDAEERGYVDDNGKPKEDEVKAFFAELRRLTTILCPGSGGWEMLPVDLAISGGKIDAEDWEEVEASIVFFCCHWSMAKKSDRKRIGQSTATFLKASTTPSPLSVYLASLPNLTQAATSVHKAVSSVPS